MGGRPRCRKLKSGGGRSRISISVVNNAAGRAGGVCRGVAVSVEIVGSRCGMSQILGVVFPFMPYFYTKLKSGLKAVGGNGGTGLGS